MSESDNSEDFNDKSVDSIDNNNNKVNNNINNQEKPKNDDDDDFKIESNEVINEEPKKAECDSSEEIKNNNKIKENNIIQEKECTKEIINFNEGNKLSQLQIIPQKIAILVEIDEEKTKNNGYTVYQLVEIKNNSNNIYLDSTNQKNDNGRKILCYRRYSEFDKFYNTLKFRYPFCIFPRLSEKKYYKNDDKTVLQNRKKELQYFINKLYFHEEISKCEEFKRFISSVFDKDYYDNLPKKYVYPECEKANKEKGYWSMGVNKLYSYFSNTKETVKSEKEKEILKREEEFKNKSKKYLELLKDIKSLYENIEKTSKEYITLSNTLSYLNEDKKQEEQDEDLNFNELISLNGNLSKVYYDNIKNLLDIIDQLNYCYLDVEGINRAIERFNEFIKEYHKVKNTKDVNKYVSVEKSKVEQDKSEFENYLSKDMEKYDKENSQIYEQIIERLIFFIKKINEDGYEIFNKTNFE